MPYYFNFKALSSSATVLNFSQEEWEIKTFGGEEYAQIGTAQAKALVDKGFDIFPSLDHWADYICGGLSKALSKEEFKQNMIEYVHHVYSLKIPRSSSSRSFKKKNL